MKKTILDYFEETVRNYPANIAVADEEHSMTYEQLRRVSRKIAGQLAARSIRNQPVALLMKRGIDLPAAMLGVLYSGNFYAVLDVDSPRDRLETILNTLSPAAILYEPEVQSLVDAWDIPGINVNEAMENSTVPKPLLDTIQQEAVSTDPAYVLFTSGSTGTPKGAILTHANVIHYIAWFTNCFGITSETVFGSQTALYFSMSVSDFYGSMFTGARYQMIPKSYFAFPARLVSFFNEKQINTIYWVPSALGVAVKFDLFRYGLPGPLHTVLFAGEVMPVKYLNYWKNHLPDVWYANLFGPTETTDICAYYVVDREFSEDQALPIGTACDNCQLYILDSEGNPVSGDTVGELYVGGPFVARGYYASPEKTRAAFMQNPLQDDYPEPVYRTGDLVCRNTYGELEYVGRKDFQVKHLGYRIEPSEVEAVFHAVKDLHTAVCLYDPEQDQLILAYESSHVLDQELQEIAQAKLPHYMRPSIFQRLDQFPQNASGKISRSLLLKTILESR